MHECLELLHAPVSDTRPRLYLAFTLCTCGVAVELVKGVPVGGLEVATTQALYPEPGRCHVLALLPDVLPLALFQLHQEIVESPVTLILPARRRLRRLPIHFTGEKPSFK